QALRARECRHVILQHRRRTKSAESRIQRVVPGILTPCEFFARPRCLTRPLRGKADMTLCNANVRFGPKRTSPLALGVTSGVNAQQPPPAPPPLPQAPSMTFFVTGAGLGKGADLGGIEGADQHCQTLAQRHGAGGKTWRAYLSTQEAAGKPAVNARDRIGNGPWQNFKGQVVATSL